MASTEDIEAKLAAYVDGDLGEADRAEIEKHLTTNPQHRQLIEELMQQRTLLKGLPRETAPTDIADSINAQLERAVLLGDTEDQMPASSSMRISPWHQFRAVAAVLVLFVGLAAAVYYMLPSPTGPAPQITDIRSLPSAPTDELAKDKVLGEDRKDTFNAKIAVAKAGEGEKSFKTAAPVTDTEQQRRAKDAIASSSAVSSDRAGGERGGFGGGGGGAGGGGGFGNPGFENRAGKVLSNAESPATTLFRDVVSNQLARNGSNILKPDEKSVVLVLATNDVAKTNRTVTAYLDNNNIKWAAETEPMPGRLDLSTEQQLSGSRFNRARVQMKGEGPAPGQTAAASPTTEGVAAQNGQTTASNLAVSQSQQPQHAEQQQVSQVPQRAEQLPPQPTQAPKEDSQRATGQVAEEQQQAARGLQREGAYYEQQQRQQLKQSTTQLEQQQQEGELRLGTRANDDAAAIQPGQLAYAYANGGQLIVARQVPRAQAIEICNTLNINNGATVPQSVQLNAAPVALNKTLEDADVVAAKPAGPQGAGGANELQGNDFTARHPSAATGAAMAPATTQPDAANQPAATQPATARRLIEVGDTLTVNVPQLAGTGVEAKTVQRVADGGTISLPMIEPIKVVGMSETDLSDAITQRYRDLKVMTEATPEVTVAPTPPASQPAGIAWGDQPRKQVVMDDGFGIAPATQQAVAAADFVDVFIVLAPDAAVAGAPPIGAVQTPAATQPANEAAREAAEPNQATPATTAPVQQ